MKTFIYALVDPRDGRVRYVGKANDPARRMSLHVTELRRPYVATNKAKLDWLSEVISAGLRPEVLILEEVISEAWQESERRWIAKMREQYHDLTNVHAGGDGSLLRTEETRRKIGESRRGRTNSIECRARLSAALKGRHVRPEVLAARIGRKLSPEHVAKIAAANRGKKRNAEAIANLTAAQRRRDMSFLTPELRSRISASSKARKYSQETINKRRQSRSWYSHSPETRAKIGASNRLAAERRRQKAAL